MKTMLLTDDSAARAIAIDISQSAIAKAPAGSGKTTLLVHRFLAALLTVDAPESVLAITFTRKAAGEMRHRIAEALSMCSQPAPSAHHLLPLWRLSQDVMHHDQRLGWRLRDNLDRLRVMTLDGLNASIIRHAPLFSGIGGGIQVDDDVDLLYRDAVQSLMPYMDDAADPVAADIQSVMELASNRLETLCDLLTPLLATRDQWLEQAARLRSDPTALDGFLSQWLSSLVADRLLMLRELAGSPLMDFATALQSNGLIDDVPDNFTPGQHPSWRSVCEALLTTATKPAIRKTVNKANGFPPGSPGLEGAKAALQDLAEIEGLADLVAQVRALPSPHEIEGAKHARASMARVLVLLAAELKVSFTRAGRVDHIEVAMRANMALVGAGGAAPLLQQVDETLRHIMVDEAQDTSISQIRTIQLLTEGWQPGDGRSLFIVGDPQQSIYAFRQAEVRLFIELWSNRALGDIPLTQALLTRNYRSHDEIVQTVNDVFSQSMPIRDEPYSGSVAYSPSAPTQGPGGSVRYATFSGPQPKAEAQALAESIAGLPPAETVAVLVSARAALTDVLPALREAGISYACHDIDLVTQTDHVRDLVSVVKALWHPLDRSSWITMLRAPFVGLTWSAVQAVTQNPHETVEAQLRTSIASQPGRLSSTDLDAASRFVDALDQMRQTTPIGSSLSERTQALWMHLNGHLTVAPSQYPDIVATLNLVKESETAGVIGDLAALDRSLGRLFAEAGDGRVQVMTIHKAKGLEFDHVYLPGLWRKPRAEDTPALTFRSVPKGIVIASRADRGDDQGADRLYRVIRNLNVTAAAAERQRLLYVAFTRAKRQLSVYAMTKVDPKTGADSTELLNSESLLQSIWPAISSSACATRCPAAIPMPTALRPAPLTFTLTPAARNSQAPSGYRPPVKSTLRPSEKLLRPEVSAASNIDLFARYTGIVFHGLVDRWIKTDRGHSFEGNLPATELSMLAGFRRLGLSEAQIPLAIDAVVRMARSMLAGPNGQWILQGRTVEGSERRVSGFIRDQWVDGVIDRYFLEAGCSHIVDYKSSSPPPTALASAALHGGQMSVYSRVLTEALSLPARAYIYYPQGDVLHLLADENADA